MECTQRLENTQDLYSTQTENVDLEQIGFLGICGTKYPVKKGPNKIGRDPSTCTIVLNLNSISRQHAVINVLNRREFILMDLDSANRTKLSGVSLKPYIPQPLHNGDTVQFGDVFGIFRLLEEEDDLPMTQAIDVPDTPVVNRHVRCKPAVIPESPDVSGDDSFVMPSQPFKSNHPFKSPSNKYIKPGAKTVSIQPIGGHKIDNIYWNSSKKSASFSLNDSTTSVNDSTTSIKSNQENGDIHEMETQAPYRNDSTDSIYNAATQIPTENNSPSIHSLETQLPTSSPDENDVFTANKEKIFNAETQFEKKDGNKDIFEVDTQIPSGGNSDDIFEAETEDFERPVVSKREDNNIFDAETQDFESDLNTKESKNVFEAETQDFRTIPNTSNSKDKTIFEAETQVPDIIKNKSFNSTNDSIYDAQTQLDIEINESSDSKSNNKSNINKSNDIVLFDEVDTQDFEEPFDSQPIIAPEAINDDDEINLTQTEPKINEKVKPKKRNNRIESDSSTDCEDIEICPKQNAAKKVIQDDSTDCEDLFESEIDKDNKVNVTPADNSKSSTNIEDLPTQILKDDVIVIESPKKANIVNVASKPDIEDLPTQVLAEDKVEENFEDLATQVLGDDPIDNLNEAETQQIFSEEIVSPFKVPLQTPLKNKKRDSKPNDSKRKIPELKVTHVSLDEGEQYYAATQDILNDLCTQMELSPESAIVEDNKANTSKKAETSNVYVLDKSLSSDNEEKVNTFVNSLTKDEIKEVIGVDSQVDGLKRVPSDPSDVEVTPKKLRPFRLMGTDLPNSQEIKIGVSHNKTITTESSSESEDSQKHDTPLLFKKHKKKRKLETKINLNKKFDSNVLPTRVITRVRKPTSKVIENINQDTKTLNESILKPKYLTELDDEPDKDIITENIIRLKSYDKKNKGNDTILDKSKKSSPKQSSSLNETTKTKGNETLVDKSKNRSPNASNETTKSIGNESVLDKSKKNFNESTKSDKQEPSTSKDSLKAKSPEVKKETRKRTSKKSTESDSNRDSNEGSGRSKRSRRYENKSSEKDNDKQTHTEDKKDAQNSDKKHSDKNDKRRSKKDDRKDKKHTSKDDKTHTDINKNLTEKVDNKVIVTDEETLTKSSNAILSTSNTYKKESNRTRAKKSKNEIEQTEPQKKKRGRPKKVVVEVEVRRSSRQKVKEDELTKSILKKNISVLSHENSTVYSISSDSEISPRIGKRSALELDLPSPKRTRSGTNSNVSLRSTPRLRTQYVLFTAFPCEEVKTKLEKLGAVIVNDVRSCTLVLTLQIKRTFKLLCAVGLGKPIVGPQWVQACVDNQVIVDPWLHLIKDTVTEQRFKFDLQKTLSGKRNFLKGYHVSSTPNVMPSPPEMKLIVECSGGTWKASKPQWICVSCSSDQALWRNLKQQGAIIVTSEFILSGVLRQKMDIDNNRLD